MLSLKEFINEGYGNSEPFGDISKDGSFIDYFGIELKVGDRVVFLATDFRDSKDFYRAEISGLTTDKGGVDYVILKNIESPYSISKIKNGSKKRADLCIKINI